MNLDSEPEIIFKWTNLCRLCLSPDSHIDLFSSDANYQDSLANIRSCLNLLVYYGDPMPTKLCSQCHLKLSEWCDFRKKCIESEASIKKRLQPYKDIKFVKEYFERCAKFESSEIVSSSSKSNTGSIHNSDEVNSSVSAQEYSEDFGKIEESKKRRSDSTPEKSSSESQDYPSINNYTTPKPSSSDFSKITIKKELGLQKQGPKRDWPGNENEILGTIVSVTGGASALWDTQYQNRPPEEPNYYYNNSDNLNTDERSKQNQFEYSNADKTCPNCGLQFDSEEDFELHSCCLIGSSSHVEDYDGHFEDSISFESDYEGDTFMEDLQTDSGLPSTPVKITPWKCLACKIYFQSRIQLRRHYSSVSCIGKRVKALNCEFCFRQFLSYNELLQHQVVHLVVNINLTEDDLLCCSQCSMQFPDEKRLKNHFLIHALKRKQPIKYTCSTCSKVFFQKDLYEQHLTSHKLPERPASVKLEGPPLGMDASSPNEGPSTTVLLETVPTDSPSQEEKKPGGAIRCFRCGQMFASIKQLEHHEAMKHKNPTPYSCRKCGLRFSARSQLLMHLRVHATKGGSKTEAEVMEQTNTCTLCNAKFLLEADLESHMRTHKAPTPISEPPSPSSPQEPKEGDEKGEMFAKYKCSLCSRLYVRASSCIRHGQQSHKGQKVVPLRLKRLVFLGRRTSLPVGGKVKHKCPKCPRYFFSFHAYSDHAFRNHGLKITNPNDDPNNLETEDQPIDPKGSDEIESKCPFCAKDIKPSYISLHIKKFHRGEVLDPSLVNQEVPSDSCVCRYCLKQCSTPHNRKLHESIHYPSKTQKNQCETCGQNFSYQTEYEEHTRTCKSIRCGKCLKIFFKYTNLTQHSCSGVIKTNEYHTCTICLSAFTSLDLLQIHIKNFHGKKPELSPTQPGTSQFARTVEREIWREESNKIVCMVGQKFYCTFCDCEFNTTQESNDHRAAAHPRGNWYTVQISDCMFQCTICDKFFASRKSSLIHINYHKKNLQPEQPKPYPLSFEPEVEIFTDLQKQIETPKIIKYNCRYCGGAYKDEEDLQQHLFLKHINQA